jgi:hypothetical protein
MGRERKPPLAVTRCCSLSGRIQPKRLLLFKKRCLRFFLLEQVIDKPFNKSETKRRNGADAYDYCMVDPKYRSRKYKDLLQLLSVVLHSAAQER